MSTAPRQREKPGKAPETSPRRSAGRPRIEFDLATVEGLGRIGATAFDMTHVLPASQSTIEHRMADESSDFSKAYKKGQALLNASLRRKQIQVAMTGNVTMLIWLGKQHLGQQDCVYLPNVDLSQCTDEQLERIAAGDRMEVVLGWRRSEGLSRPKN